VAASSQGMARPQSGLHNVWHQSKHRRSHHRAQRQHDPVLGQGQLAEPLHPLPQPEQATLGAHPMPNLILAIPTTKPVWVIRKFKIMISVCLAGFVVTLSSNKANHFVLVQTNWTDKMVWLSLGQIAFQPVNHIVLASSEKLISSFLIRKLILLLKFLAQCPERDTDLNIHHIGSSKFNRQSVQKVRGFVTIRHTVFAKKAGESFDRFSSFTSGTSRGASKSDSCSNSRKVHNKFSKLQAQEDLIYRHKNFNTRRLFLNFGESFKVGTSNAWSAPNE
jgi:hypothetical protein